jgi:hypothetical protein
MLLPTRLIHALVPTERFSEATCERVLQKLSVRADLEAFFDAVRQHLSLDDAVPVSDPVSIHATEAALISVMEQSPTLAQAGLTAVVAIVRDDIALWEEYFGCRLTDGNEPCPHWQAQDGE